MFIQGLPEELLDLCLLYLNTQSLGTVRLVSKQLLPAATKRLFEHVALQPTAHSAEKARTILNHETLNPLVTTIAFHTSEDPLKQGHNALYNEAEDTAGELPEVYEEVVHEVGRFRNLRQVQLIYAMEVAAPKSDAILEKEVVQTWEWRNVVLKMLVESLNDQDHPANKVQALTIRDLQDMTVKKTVTSKDFKAVLSRLDTLELQIATEYVDAAPETSIELEEVHTFFGIDLKQYWLRPVQHQLVHLKLYARETYWGYLPFFDPQDLHFPALKHLALGNYSFTHDWQLDWILSHAETLQSLVLDDCPIVHACRIYPACGPDRMPPDYKTFNKYTANIGPDSEWVYGSRWHDYFRRMRDGLPELRHFACGHGPWDEGRSFDASDSLQAHLALQRYCIFDGSTGPSPWIEPERVTVSGTTAESGIQYDCCWNGDTEPPKYPDCEKEDQAALDDLMETIRCRA